MISETAGTPDTVGADLVRADSRRRIVLLVIDCVLAGVLVASVLVGDRVGAQVLLVVGVVGTGLRIFANRVHGHGERRRAGWEARVLRALSYAAVMVGFARGTSFDPGLVAAFLGLGVLLLLNVLEPELNRVARFVPPLVAHLPGVSTRPRGQDRSPLLPRVGIVAAALGMVVDLFGGSGWWWLAGCLVAVIPSGLIAFDGRAKVVYARRLREHLPEAFAAYAPDFVLYTSRPDDASYQVQMWLPYLKRSGLRFAIMTRDNVPAAALARSTDVPVVEARRIVDLDALIVPSLRAAFYVNASSGNGSLVRYEHLTHVYLGHGDSDKPPSYNPTHAMYDRIFAAGPAATRRYAAHGVHISPDKFQIVGRPQVEDIEPSVATTAPPDPVVLYAPTWRGHVEETMLYSLPVGERIVAALLDRGATVIFRPHPFSYDYAPDAAAIGRIQAILAADAQRTGRRHRWGAAAETEMSIVDCINASDAMVSDVSSVVSDYLYSNKPFAMIAVPMEPRAFCAEYPVARASYVIRGDLADLDTALDAMLGPDPMAGQRAAIRIDNLGNFAIEGYASVFVDAVRDVATSAKHAGMPADQPEDTVQLRRRRVVAGRGADASRFSRADGGAREVGTEAPSAPPGEAAERTEPAAPVRRSLGDYRRAVESALLALLAATLALLALAAATMMDNPWPVVLCTWLALATIARSAAATLGSLSRWNGLVGTANVTRAVLVTAWALLVTRAAPGLVLPMAVGLVGLTMALVGEAHIRRAWGGGGLQIVDFPQLKATVSERLPRGLVMIASTTTVALGTLATALGLPVIGLGLALVTVALFVDAAIRALVRARRAAAADAKLHRALIDFRPEFIVYFASTVGAAYQVGMWLPYFVRVGRPFVFVTRTVPMLREIASITGAAGVRVPIIYRPSLRSVEEVIVPSMTTAFYVNNAARNTHLVERRELTHVWLNHGDSEKPACFNPVHAIYDLIFAAGQAGIDRYARHGVHIPRESFRIVGRPQVESITRAERDIRAVAEPTVLYAPTWQGPFSDSRVFSLPLGTAITRWLLSRNVRVIFRPHPFNRRYRECEAMIAQIEQVLAADRAATGRQHVWGLAAEQKLTVEECFNMSDAMVCDISAVVSDYLQSGKPFSIVSVGRTPEQLLREAPAARAAYVLREDLSNIEAVLDDLLEHDPLAAVRAETRSYYLGDFDEAAYAEGFLTAARAVIDQAPPLPGSASPQLRSSV